MMQEALIWIGIMVGLLAIIPLSVMGLFGRNRGDY